MLGTLRTTDQSIFELFGTSTFSPRLPQASEWCLVVKFRGPI